MDRNQLFFGDNLDVLRDHIRDESVDLIYLDPPFNSNKIYNVLYSEQNGTPSESQMHAFMHAFDDTWIWDQNTALAFHQLVEGGHEKVNDTMIAFRKMLGECNLLAYLTMMAPRLIEMRRVLKDTGSIYLHCDPTASHYLKMLLDAVFGTKNFRNEITWVRTAAHSDAKNFSHISDIIFYYSKISNYNFQLQYKPYSKEYINKYYRHTDEQGLFLDRDLTAKGLSGGGYEYEWKGVSKIWRCPITTMKKNDKQGRLYYTSNGTPRYKQYLDEMPGVPIPNVWSDTPPINSQANEALGYPTQKPEALLERIIKSSSNKGDIILDPFCGCGTAVSVAEQLNRKWIGIDITYLAIALINNRLQSRFSEITNYDVIGVPTSLSDAKALALHDRYQFQTWVILLANAFPRQKKGSDRGVDGFLNFHDDNSGKTKKILIQVKSGKVKSGDIRDLVGTIEREKAVIGVFITLEHPTSHMIKEAASVGFYQTEHVKKPFPKIQLLTVEQILDGKQIEYPFAGISNVGMKKAVRFIDKALTPTLFDDSTK